VADGVDASVQAYEPSGRDAVVDGAISEPRVSELQAGDEAVLAGGDLGGPEVRCVNWRPHSGR
jgi:hypothetical protein